MLLLLRDQPVQTVREIGDREFVWLLEAEIGVLWYGSSWSRSPLFSPLTYSTLSSKLVMHRSNCYRIMRDCLT